MLNFYVRFVLAKTVIDIEKNTIITNVGANIQVQNTEIGATKFANDLKDS